MELKEEWIPLTWHCPHCGAVIEGHKDKDGIIRIECDRCGIVMVQKFKDRQRERIDIYAAKLKNRQQNK